MDPNKLPNPEDLGIGGDVNALPNPQDLGIGDSVGLEATDSEEVIESEYKDLSLLEASVLGLENSVRRPVEMVGQVVSDPEDRDWETLSPIPKS